MVRQINRMNNIVAMSGESSAIIITLRLTARAKSLRKHILCLFNAIKKISIVNN